MPFLEGPFAFTGTLDQFSAYRMRGVDKIVVRRKGGPSAEKVKTSPSFKNTRHTMSEFGGCSRHGSYVRMAMLQIRHLSDYNFGSDINSILRQVQLRDGTGEWGRRRITLSEHTRMLEGFSTMRKAPSFDSIVRTPVYYTMDRTNRSARIEIPELMRDINYFPQNNHAMFRLTVTLGIVPDVAFDVSAKEYLPPTWYDRAYYSKSISTMWNPSLEGMESTILDVAMDALPPDDRWTLMLSIGIEYGAFREYGEIKAVARVGAAKILALRGKDTASGGGVGGDGIGKEAVQSVSEVVIGDVPVVEVEQGPEGYVYAMKAPVAEISESRVYRYTISTEDVDCTADTSTNTAVMPRPVVRSRGKFNPDLPGELATTLVADLLIVGPAHIKQKRAPDRYPLYYPNTIGNYFTKRMYLPSFLIITNVSVPAVPVYTAKVTAYFCPSSASGKRLFSKKSNPASTSASVHSLAAPLRRSKLPYWLAF
ncbi:hypothetical protein KK062_04220 [Fulvivirgaceae bacterium PWU5]|uniref:Uncharacterized protein n=1 Tax=Dawidia cretensis TaxID=2782350 RepID=A0AAP2DTZ1_9BACT|nr:hypothetical protein [Dawidia cretensis]MBT1707410.1 hypothetical protein [Dawidia cretensis]